jgi:hypothetical protein
MKPKSPLPAIATTPQPGPSSPQPGPSRTVREITPTRETSPKPGTSRQALEECPDASRLFERETRIFDNDNFSFYIQKQDHQRQKVKIIYLLKMRAICHLMRASLI